MRISEVTIDYLASYLRLDEPSALEKNEIEQAKDSAVSFISGYTGLSKDELDNFPDITQVMLILVADAFDNRNLYIEGKAVNLNNAVESILSSHSKNLL